MFEKFTNKFLLNTLAYGFGSIFIGFPWIVASLYENYSLLSFGLIILFLFVVSYATYNDVRKDEEKEIIQKISQLNLEIASEKSNSEDKIKSAKKEAEEIVSETKQETNSIIIQCQNKIKVVQHEAEELVKDAEIKVKVSEQKEQLSKQLLKERASGFPTLFNILSQYDESIDNYFAGWFVSKPHPAVRTSEVIKEEAKRRRIAEFLQRKTQSLIEYYENIAPFLLDFKEQEFDDTEDALRD